MLARRSGRVALIWASLDTINPGNYARGAFCVVPRMSWTFAGPGRSEPLLLLGLLCGGSSLKQGLLYLRD